MPELAEHQPPDTLTDLSDTTQVGDALGDQVVDGFIAEETSTVDVESGANTSAEDGQTTEETDEVRDSRIFTPDDFKETEIGEGRKSRRTKKDVERASEDTERAIKLFEDAPIGSEGSSVDSLLDTKSTELVSNYVALMAEIVGEVGDTNLDDAIVDKARAVQREFNERLASLGLDVAAESAVVRVFNTRLMSETSETPTTSKSDASQLSLEPAVELKLNAVEASVEAKVGKSNRFVSWVRTAAKGFINASGLGIRNINTVTGEYEVVEPAIVEASMPDTQENILDDSSDLTVEPKLAPAATLLGGVNDTSELPVIASLDNEHHRDVGSLIEERDRLEGAPSLGTLATIGEPEYTIDRGAEDSMIGAREGEDARRYSLRERRQLAKDGKGKFTAMDGTQFLDRNGKLPALVIPRKLDVAGNEVDDEGKIIPKEDRVFVDEDGGASRFRTQNVRSIARQARTYGEGAAMAIGEVAQDAPLRIAEARVRASLLSEGITASLSSKRSAAKSRIEQIRSMRHPVDTTDDEVVSLDDERRKRRPTEPEIETSSDPEDEPEAPGKRYTQMTEEEMFA